MAKNISPMGFRVLLLGPVPWQRRITDQVGEQFELLGADAADAYKILPDDTLDCVLLWEEAAPSGASFHGAQDCVVRVGPGALDEVDSHWLLARCIAPDASPLVESELAAVRRVAVANLACHAIDRAVGSTHFTEARDAWSLAAWSCVKNVLSAGIETSCAWPERIRRAVHEFAAMLRARQSPRAARFVSGRISLIDVLGVLAESSAGESERTWGRFVASVFLMQPFFDSDVHERVLETQGDAAAIRIIARRPARLERTLLRMHGLTQPTLRRTLQSICPHVRLTDSVFEITVPLGAA